MSAPEWCYHILHKCPTCGQTWDEYDHTGSGWDSGLHSSPVIKEECNECFAERRAADLKAQEEDAL
jgi:hypothetical protein